MITYSNIDNLLLTFMIVQTLDIQSVYQLYCSNAGLIWNIF